MSNTNIKRETQKYLHSTALNVIVLLEHVRKFEGSDEPLSSFSGPEFRDSVKELASAIDKEATRFIIACKPPALDSDIRTMCPKISAGLFHLVKKFDCIPKTAGKSYMDSVRKAICRTLVSAIGLINSFIEEKVDIDKTALYEVAYTSASGIFWEHCKTLVHLPVDNRAAVTVIWQNSIGNLVKDAVEELQETVIEYENSEKNNDGEKADVEGFSDDSMDDLDPELPPGRLEDVHKVQRLVIATKRACDKIALGCIRDCKTLDEEHIIWLDRLVDLGKPVQDAVDEVVAALFIEDDSWKRQVELESSKLKQLLSELLTLAITFVDDSHLKWFELCCKQLDAMQEITKIVR
ncbi:hypothetical protein IW140_001416 [Coemansia sp. RSA 1813]|nr:hypothetical protein LPJ74_001627 [Coemansia sp. RSA 1843]KAJ2091829.1 hypothetical protein IW138_001518 [Coemansia sp. RSA 986]KAJ2215844.1 hypothetical protein EV179_001864 [Coemansia sp. RSA 487]KAJ2571775.1 hypothetical protein IW140_001416 [Coemansia sp. RSA 1813]